MPDPEGKATPVFVSYSHRGERWLKRLQVHLTPLVRGGGIDLWDDARIRPGDDWQVEINRALAAARVAVLLVSPDFLASDFIRDKGLPPLLEAAERRGIRILPLILSHCLYTDPPLGRFHAVNDPDWPLEQLTKANRDKTLSELAKDIARGLSAGTVATARTRLKGKVMLVGSQDERTPAEGVMVILEEIGDSERTKAGGLFDLPLPDAFRPGERIRLQVHKEGWWIQYPLDGELPVPAPTARERVEI